ncbi:universal stress protein [Streptomyces mirabilis]|uniref:universal stress protein n=1 Tax=Streptomyces mirabilis TaxID=68239 RepID=UPI0036C29405
MPACEYRPNRLYRAVRLPGCGGAIPKVHSLLEATREAAVVVVGAHGHPHRIGPRPGPVTAVLLHHSHCPVAIV